MSLRISELPAGSSAALTDQLEANQSGTSRRLTVAQVIGAYQTVSTQTGAVATGTTIIPVDDTIPQISEGTEFMTLAITPRSATSRLIIEVTIMLATTATGAQNLVAALFQDSTANALAAMSATSPTTTSDTSISFRHIMTSGTTSATTFRVRGGNGTAGTTTFNGSGGSGGTRRFGGVMASSIVIYEVPA